MSLWIPLYESNDETAQSVIATFFQVFPNGMLFSNDIRGAGYDAVLLGQAEPARIDLDGLQQRLDGQAYRRVKESLMEVGFGGSGMGSAAQSEEEGVATALFATYAGRALDLREWSRNAQINTDRNLRLQYLAGMWLNSYRETEILNGILKYFKFPGDVFVGSAAHVQALKNKLHASRRLP